MAKKMDFYFPLIVGDWLKGTRGMKANVKGVYIGLLLFQWDNGYVPESLEELEDIEREVGSVWVSLSEKFPVVSPGRRQNDRCEEVRKFFQKQAKNGSKGGRPKKGNPNVNPDSNPNQRPPFDLDLSVDLDLSKEGGVGETIQPATDSETLSDAEHWTNQVIYGDDATFVTMVRGLQVGGKLDRLARDHLGKVARYGWHDKIKTQQAFRLSLVNFITEQLEKNSNGETHSGSGSGTTRTATAIIQPGKSFGSLRRGRTQPGGAGSSNPGG